MTPYEARTKVQGLLDELRASRFVPNEERDRDHPGQLGFDYGYQQATFEIGSKLYLIFPDDDSPLATQLDLGRLARAIKVLIRDFTWESENVRLELVVGPIPYGPGPWMIGGNPDGNVAVAIGNAYTQDGEELLAIQKASL